MKARYLRPVGALIVAVAAGVALGPLSAQAPAKIAKPWTMPRMPDGKPDLQGTWSNATLTPMDRPANQPLVMTKEQVAQIEGRTQQVKEYRERPSDPNRPAPPKGGEARDLPPGEPTFIERLSQSAGGAVGGYNNFWLDPGDRVLVVNGEPRSSIIVDPPDGRVPPLAPEARQRTAQRMAETKKFGEFDHPELRGLAERCLMSFGTNAGPPMLPNYFYNNNYQIVQTKDHVMILVEMVHDVRTIRIDNSPTKAGAPPAASKMERLPKNVRPWMGDSIGRWEGDTLVVETTNFHPLQSLRGASENLTVTERFTRSGPDTINYRFTIEDPTTFTAPWSGELTFNRFDEMIFEYACHEGNYALSNVLSGERSREKREAEKKKPQ